LDTANAGVYLGSAAVLATAALAAMLFPARRGARGDPMKALHYE
jgi:ABC-type antimicrobial peptide transport system permease subunit